MTAVYGRQNMAKYGWQPAVYWLRQLWLQMSTGTVDGTRMTVPYIRLLRPMVDSPTGTIADLMLPNLTLRHFCRHMRLHYQLSMCIESWYWMLVWPGMHATIGSVNEDVRFSSTKSGTIADLAPGHTMPLIHSYNLSFCSFKFISWLLRYAG